MDEDAYNRQVESKQRAKTALHHNISLSDTLKWYRQCENDESRDDDERLRWKSLADELERRVTPQSDTDQLPLF